MLTSNVTNEQMNTIRELTLSECEAVGGGGAWYDELLQLLFGGGIHSCICIGHDCCNSGQPPAAAPTASTTSSSGQGSSFPGFGAGGPFPGGGGGGGASTPSAPAPTSSPYVCVNTSPRSVSCGY